MPEVESNENLVENLGPPTNRRATNARLIYQNAMNDGVDRTMADKEVGLDDKYTHLVGPISIRTTTVMSKISKKLEKSKSELGVAHLNRKRNYSNGSSDMEESKKIRTDTNGEESPMLTTASLNDLDGESVSHKSNQIYNGTSIEDPNLGISDIYQDLLNGVTREGAESNKAGLGRKLRRIGKKDLEEMMIETFMSKLYSDEELSRQRELCKRLEATLEASNRRAAALTKEVMGLKEVTQRLSAEYNKRKKQLVIPVKLKRSVGIQANEYLIEAGVNGETSDVHIIIPSIFKKQTENEHDKVHDATTNLLEKTRKLAGIFRRGRGSSQSSEDSISKTKISKTKTTHNFSLMNVTKGVIAFYVEFRFHFPLVIRGFLIDSPSLPDAEDSDVIVSDLVINNHTIQLPPLPPEPPQNDDSCDSPPRPIVSLYRQKGKGVTVKWKLKEGESPTMIDRYEIYSYSSDGIAKATWRKVGTVGALELPMSCNLIPSKVGGLYFFIVRAVSKKGFVGPFSSPRYIDLDR